MKKYLFIFGLVLVSFLFSGLVVNAADVCSNGAPVWTPSAASVQWTQGEEVFFSMEQGYSNDWQSTPPPLPWPNTYSDSCTAAATNGAKCSVYCLDKIKYQDFAVCPNFEQRLSFCDSPENKIDNVPPTCGSWSGSGPTYTLGVGSDTGNVGGDSGLASGSTSEKSCTATENSTPTPWTCKIDIYDKALNKTTCTSPQYAPYSCLGSDPSNATICSGDDSGLGNNVAKSIVSACTVPLKCEFTCNSGYQYQNLFGIVSCVPITYSCTPAADPAHANLCSGDASGLAENTGKTVVPACTALTKCEYSCASGYVATDGGIGIYSCVPISGVSCTASHIFTPTAISASGSTSEWYNFTNWDTTKFDYTWRCVNDSVTKSGNLSQNNLTQTKTVDGTTFIVGKTTTCTVTATPKSGVTGTGCSAEASLTVEASALSCSPATQTVAELQGANFSATGGTGTLYWSTSGSPYGSPMSGTGNSFWTSYGQCGGKTITVTDSGGQTASCALTVTGAACGGGCPVGQPNPHFTCQNGACTRVSSCGVSSDGCNGGNVGSACSGGCPTGELNPHFTCQNNACTRVDACGTSSGGCNSGNVGSSCDPGDGTIVVNSSPSSSWTITGPETHSDSGTTKTYLGVTVPGVYTLTPQAGFQVATSSQTLVADQTITFNIFSDPSVLSCYGGKSNARINEVLDYTASGGTGAFSWSGGGTPPSGGNQSSFSTSFGTAGNYLVRVTRGTDTVDCPAVVVSEPPTVSVILSANPVSGMIDLLSRITAVVGGTATGPINYQFWKDCQGSSCGTPDVTVDSDAVSEYTEFTYTTVKTNHPKVTVVREGITDSVNTTVDSTPKKYACVSGSCSISAGGAYNSMASCADACVHSECTALNACASIKADPITGVGGPNRCTLGGDDCPIPERFGCVNNSCIKVAGGAYGTSNCGGVCNPPPPQKYSCGSGSCQPDVAGQYSDSTCGGVCSPTYYSCSSGACTQDANGQFTSVDCNNMCTIPIHSECNGPACVNVAGVGENNCNADSGPQGCGGVTESHFGCINSSCVILGGPGENSCNAVGQYCGGAGKCSLKAAPPLVSGGQSVKLTWQCAGNPTGCKLTRKYKTPGATVITLDDNAQVPGSASDRPASSATYTLDCTGSTSDVSADVRVSTLIECAPTDPTCKP